jgi:hypothetical protein
MDKGNGTQFDAELLGYFESIDSALLANDFQPQG